MFGPSPVFKFGGEWGPVTLVAFKAIDSVLRGQNGGFDSHTLPPISHTIITYTRARVMIRVPVMIVTSFNALLIASSTFSYIPGVITLSPCLN